MYPLLSLSAAWLQGTDSVAIASTTDAHLTMIFVGFIAFFCLVVLLILLGVVVAVLILRKKVSLLVADATKKAQPAISAATEFLNEVTPQVRKITGNVASISETVRGKVEQIDDTITDVNKRTKVQVARVDGFVSETLNTTADLASSIQKGVRVPVREFAGIMAGFKAAVDVLAGRDKASSVDQAAREASETAASVTPITSRRETAVEPLPPAQIRKL